MLYIIAPVANNYGWGVCGKHLTKELSRLLPVRLITQDPQGINIQNALEQQFFSELLASPEEVERLKHGTTDLVLQGINDHRLEPYAPRVKAARKVGYTFFESLVPDSAIQPASLYFDVIATGSDWCTEQLHSKGIRNAVTVHQGIDPLSFHPGFARKEMFLDRFVVFSGGKLELRKGHDLVIAAYKVLQDRHDDVMLLTCWNNLWEVSMASMAQSPHIRFRWQEGNRIASTKAVLEDNGIDLRRVCAVPLYPNEVMGRIYQNTDIGLFPNRCEGGTNLVLMEYMACGKPVIASNSTGQRDILTEGNAILVQPQGQVRFDVAGRTAAIWDDFKLDDVVDGLEWAYQHRDDLASYAQHAARDTKTLTWKQAAQTMLSLLTTDLVI